MSKKRFIYWLVSIVVSLFLIGYIWLSDDLNILFYSLLVGLLIMPNFTFKKIEKQKLMQIIIYYSQTGNADEYLKQLKAHDEKTDHAGEREKTQYDECRTSPVVGTRNGQFFV